MKIFIPLLALLSTLGCQTAKHTCPTDPQTQKVSVSVFLVNDRGMKTENIEEKTMYDLKFMVSKLSGVVSHSQVKVHPNVWAKINVAIDIHPLEQTARVLVEDEVIEIDCEPGLHVMVKATPLDENRVHLKGAYSLSKASEKDLTKPKDIFPFSAFCFIGETTTLYELNTKLEPVN